MEDPAGLLTRVVDIVTQSGQRIRDDWQKRRAARHKGPTDLVTDTDLGVEKFLLERLADVVPEAGFMAEESAPAQGGDLVWIIDPVDGTTNFVHRIPQVATSVALWRNGAPLLGVVNVPMLGECFCAARGLGSFLNGRRIRVSQAATLADTLLATGFPYEFEGRMPLIMARLGAVLPKVQGLRRIGAAAVDLAYVACGRLDAFYEDWLKPWDMAAGWLLVEEAGGTVSNLSGGAMSFGMPLLASNGLVHEALAGILGGLDGA